MEFSLRPWSSLIFVLKYLLLIANTSSSCGWLVAFSHLEGPSGPLDPTPLPQVTVDIDPSFIVINETLEK